jgi:MutS domain V
MTYFLIILLLVIVLIIVISKNSNEKFLTAIRSQWARPNWKTRNFELIGKYTAYYKGNSYHRLNSQTVKDIDLESLFYIVDRTVTGIGQQYLYARILHPENDLSVLQSIDRITERLITEKEVRESASVILSRLEPGGTYWITGFFGPIDKSVAENKFIFNLLTYTTAALALASIFVPGLILLLIPFVAVNITIQFIFKYRKDGKYKAITKAYGLIQAAKKLTKVNTGVDTVCIPESLKLLAPFVRAWRFMNIPIPEDDLSKALFYVVELVKSAFLVDVNRLIRSYSVLSKEADALHKLFKFVAETDMLISIANLKSDRNLATCIPELIEEEKILKFIDATHPLIGNCTPNSFSLEHKSAFITGSNMSGKSTFLRVILINSILAQTLHICFAKSYTSSFVKSFSCIAIEDNLAEGSSYFFKEVEIMKNMTQQLLPAQGNLFIIDEIFKGTNTVERISLAKALLHYLNNENNMVIASSHDLELIQLLSKDFELFYFTETVRDNILYFDHTIKPGSLSTTNAIKIVAMEGFPREIIDEAYETTKKFRGENSLFKGLVP